LRRQLPLIGDISVGADAIKPMNVSQAIMHCRVNSPAVRTKNLQTESAHYMEVELVHRMKLDELQKKLELQILVERYACYALLFS
jgi:hypothetical protein